jgi:hypothetical protein
MKHLVLLTISILLTAASAGGAALTNSVSQVQYDNNRRNFTLSDRLHMTLLSRDGQAADKKSSGRPENIFDVRDFGAKFDKQSDDAPAINRAIVSASRIGGGIVLLPAGETVVSSIFIKSGVRLFGMGDQSTYIRCKSTCVTADSDAQLAGVHISGLNFRPATDADRGLTVIRFASLAKSLISDILIEGFVNGTALSIGGQVPNEILDSNLSGNVAWNEFKNISVFGCNICFVLQGKYGTGASVAPDAPSPVPNGQVVTANKFDNVNLYYVGGVGWDLRLAVDTNIWIGGLIELQGRRSAAIMLGNDPSFVGNTYVNSNKFIGVAFTRDSSFVPEYQVLFGSKNFTFGNEASNVDADIDVDVNGFHVIDMPNAVNYRICGKQLDLKPTSRSGFRLGCLEKGLAWQDQQIVNGLRDGFVVQALPNANKVILSGPGVVRTGLVRLPCRPPDGLRLTVATAELSVDAQYVKGCEEKDRVAGQGGRISPSTPHSFRYSAAISYWIRD